MTADPRWQSASEQIWQAWQSGQVIDALANECRPATREDGYAIQACLEQRTGYPLYGWKIAATSSAGQHHIGVSGPIAGRLLQERVYESGATVAFGANRMAVAEPEFAFRFGNDVAPRQEPYTTEDVLSQVGDLHLAIEIPDSRFSDFAAVGEANLIADNACAHEFVIGPAVSVDWRSLDLAAHTMQAEVRGKVQREGLGANVLGDPRTALTWLVNEVTSLGMTLSAGQVITTGTCAVPLEIAAGDEVHMDFGVLGSVAASFS